MPKNKYPLLRRLSDLSVYILILFIGFAVRHVSQRFALKMGSIIGSIVYAVIKKRRHIALKNLRMIFANKHNKEIEKIARQSFQNMGKTLVEFLRFPKYDTSQILDMVKIDGLEYLNQAIDANKGLLIVTAHFGNWELIFHVLASFTYKLSAVAQKFKNQNFERLVHKYRVIHGGEIIEKKFASRQVLRHLRDGYCVIILGDQDAGNNGIFVDFLGTSASTAKGPIMFAMRTGATILSVFDVRKDDGSHVIKISKPLEIQSTGDLQEDIVINTINLNKALEEMIYKYPSQWLWFHNRWKTRPIMGQNNGKR